MRFNIIPGSVIAAILLVSFSACDSTPKGELIIEDLVVGTGDIGLLNRTWSVNYVSKLEDGTVFDQSTKPYWFVHDFSLSIEGWNRGIADMRVGGKRRITVPPHLAYGSSGASDENGNLIVPKNATIIFEIEFLGMPDLEVEDLDLGDGDLAEFNTLVTTRYTCTLRDGGLCPLLDGTFVDEPIALTFTVGIPAFPWVGLGHETAGYHLGVEGMREGGRRRINVPPHLAYGSRGISDFQGYYVLPNEGYEFVVELVEVNI